MLLPCYYLCYYLATTLLLPCYYLATTNATTNATTLLLPVLLPCYSCAGIERKSKPVKGEGALHFDETLEFTGVLPYHGEGHGLG